jgi:hypothetical protein
MLIRAQTIIYLPMQKLQLGAIGVVKVVYLGLNKVVWDSETMIPCKAMGYTALEIIKDEQYTKAVDM